MRFHTVKDPSDRSTESDCLGVWYWAEVSRTGSLEEKSKPGKRKAGLKCTWRRGSPHLSLCFQSPGGDLVYKLMPQCGPGHASGPGPRIAEGGSGGEAGGAGAASTSGLEPKAGNQRQELKQRPRKKTVYFLALCGLLSLLLYTLGWHHPQRVGLIFINH